jgi:GNAT superfamily N-acetyltransferase
MNKKKMNKMNITILRLSGEDILPYIDDLARLRFTVFREFPYLYDGSEAYERKYLQRYTTSDKTVIVVAIKDSKVIGASTGMPLADENTSVKTPFDINGYPLEDIFYFGESVLLKEYRGHGLGVRFFEEREAHALENGYAVTTFCAVDRPENHPLKPSEYKSLHSFWSKRGYVCLPELQARFTWKDIDEPTESPKTLTFWVKNHEVAAKDSN